MAQPRPALRALFRRTQPCAKGDEHEVLLLYRTDRRHWDLPGCRDRYDESISAYANFLQGVHDDCGSTSVRAVPNLTAVATQQTHPHLTDVWSRAYPKLRLPLGLVDAEAQSKRQRLKLNESTVGYLLEGAYEDWNSWRPRPTSSRKPHVATPLATPLATPHHTAEQRTEPRRRRRVCHAKLICHFPRIYLFPVHRVDGSAPSQQSERTILDGRRRVDPGAYFRDLFDAVLCTNHVNDVPES